MINRGSNDDRFQTFVCYFVIFAGIGFAVMYLLWPKVKGWFV